MRTAWNNETGLITLVDETQENDPETGDLIIESRGEISASCEWWLTAAVEILAMLPGKHNDDGTGYVLGPAEADEEMIGELIAQMLRSRLPFT